MWATFSSRLRGQILLTVRLQRRPLFLVKLDVWPLRANELDRLFR